MDTRRIAVAAAILLLAGCRMDPNQMLIERELRFQEDEIYRLRGSVRDYQLALESCRQENAALRQQSGVSNADPGAPSTVSSPATVLGPELVPTPQPSGLAPPRVTLPSESPPAGDARLHGASWNGAPGANAAVGAALGGAGGPAGRSAAAGRSRVDPLPRAGAPVAIIANADSSRVAGIALLAEATGGYDADGQPGDEGVTVVVQPYDQQRRLLEAPAEVAVVVLDPAEVGQAARVARWDLPAELTGSVFCTIGNTRGMKLDLPWPGDPPKHSLLHVFVRYTTRDGRALKVDRRIRVNLPNSPHVTKPEVAGWTPRRGPSADQPGQTPQGGVPSAGTRTVGAPGPGSTGAGLSFSAPPGAASLATKPDTPRLARQSAGPGPSSSAQARTPSGAPGRGVPPDSERPAAQSALPRPVWSPDRP